LKLSIITINLNNSRGLKKTLESISQIVTPIIELIVIDGGSIDDSIRVIKSNKAIVNEFISEPDKGIYDAMNKGIKLARGEFLFFLNSGDEISPNINLQAILKAAKLGPQLIAGHVMTISPDNTSQVWKTPNEFRFSSVALGHLPHQGYWFNKEVFLKFGYYDDSLKIVADWAFLLKLVSSGVTCIQTDCIFCTFYRDGISNSPESKAAQDQERLKVLRQNYKNHMLDLEQLNDLNNFKMYFFKRLFNYISRVTAFRTPPR